MVIGLFIVFLSALSFAGVEKVSVMVNGMACPFCAYGVEKKLKKVEGVKSIDIDIQKGIAILTVKDGGSINIAQVPGAIEDSGFTPDRIEIVVSGPVSRNSNGDIVMNIQDGTDSFILKGDPEGIQGYLGSKARVAGEAMQLEGGVWSIRVERVEEAE
jgi:mercuric ion binding protein